MIKIAVLGDSSTQFLTKFLKKEAKRNNLEAELFEADHSQVNLLVQNSDSELYRFDPKYVLIFESTFVLWNSFCRAPSGTRQHFASQKSIEVSQYVNFLNKYSNGSKLIYANFPEHTDNVFGNFANKIASSFLYQIRKLNLELMDLATKSNSLFINDFGILAHSNGIKHMVSYNLRVNSDLHYSLDFFGQAAMNTLGIIKSLEGKFYKCVVLDLDNTLWGGIIGDDGLERIHIGDFGIGKAFSSFQLWLKELKKRGVILAICSKNQKEVAMLPFKNHPDMVLNLDDIAVFVANWETKVDNIRYIQKVLNIGFDSMVFLDDNPAEREVVRSYIPEINVPELPEDPAEYLPFLIEQNLFETSSYTPLDSDRTGMYQKAALRTEFENTFDSQEEFLENIEMKADVTDLNEFNLPRVAQLIQRSNQFNLRTIRYSEIELQKLKKDSSNQILAISLKDKFGDYGIICCVILKENFIDTWVMSCRVLKRGVESFVINELQKIIQDKGFSSITGEYKKTSKNALVKDLYRSLGFQSQGEFWKLDFDSFVPRKHQIKS